MYAVELKILKIISAKDFIINTNICINFYDQYNKKFSKYFYFEALLPPPFQKFNIHFFPLLKIYKNKNI